MLAVAVAAAAAAATPARAQSAEAESLFREGKRLFKEGVPATLNLVSAQPFESGVVALVYEPERK